jgi:hypothetical protein
MTEQVAGKAGQAPSGPAAHSGNRSVASRTVVVLLIAVVFVVVFAFSLVGAFRNPTANQLPFGVTGAPSPVTAQVAKQISLKLPPYNAGTLVQNTIYFGGKGITSALIIFGACALFGVLAILIGWTRLARSPIVSDTEAEAAAGAAAAG